ncbi:MAG: collagen-binding protein [Flavisolibacter sp.]|nr:collagen-binding protein [Flavisolibacter sp.]
MQLKFLQKRTLEKVLVTIAILLSVPSLAQDRYTISGTVKDKITGELLIGASIKIAELKGGTTTNSYGFFSITLPQSKYKIITTYVGFNAFESIVDLSKSYELLIELEPITALQEVVVINKRKDGNVTRALMGVEKLDIKMINQLPVLLGERDVLKSIQLLPGIKSAGEGNSGFYVRGGGADQNLILLDEAPVYNASHLLGFFSTFNSDAVKDLTLYKGGMPAQYGGRLSSVVDIKMKDGNNKNFDVSGGIGVISSRINIEGPIVNDVSSFIISGRRSYADQFLKFSSDSALKNNKLYFYDLNVKANYRLGKHDRFYLSGYFGRDVLGFGETFSTDWGNSTATLRWNHVVSNKIFSNTSLIYSDYNYNIRFKTGSDKLLVTSQIQDVNLKQDFDYFINNNSKVKLGANVIRHTVSPGRVKADETSNIKSTVVENRNS